MGGGESSWGSLGRWPCLRHSPLISAKNRWHWSVAWALGPLWVNSPWYPPQSGGSYGSLGPKPWLGEPFSDFLPKNVVLLGFIAAPGLQHYARNYARIMRAQCAKPFAGVVQECVRQWMHSVRNRAIGPTLGPSLALCIMCGLCAPNARSSFHTCFLRGFDERGC